MGTGRTKDTMKKALIAFVWILVCTSGIHAQQMVYDYGYDAAGNRIRRRVVVLTRDIPGMTEVEKAGQDALDDGNVRLYPNPTQGEVNVELADGGELVKYALTDASGRLIGSGSEPTSSLRLDLSGHPDGVYLLEMVFQKEDRKEKKHYKIIKQ